MKGGRNNGRSHGRDGGRRWVGVAMTALVAGGAAAQELPYDRMAARIGVALQPARGERGMLRYDPATMPGLAPAVRSALEDAGAAVELLAYGPSAGLAGRLARPDVYIWLPAGPDAPTPADQVAALARWLDEGRGRQIHFHWGD